MSIMANAPIVVVLDIGNRVKYVKNVWLVVKSVLLLVYAAHANLLSNWMHKNVNALIIYIKTYVFSHRIIVQQKQ